jgi:hypothetical protein
MDKQARTEEAVLAKSKEMTGTVVVARGRRGKDDRKQNALVLLE